VSRLKGGEERRHIEKFIGKETQKEEKTGRREEEERPHNQTPFHGEDLIASYGEK